MGAHTPAHLPSHALTQALKAAGFPEQGLRGKQQFEAWIIAAADAVCVEDGCFLDTAGNVARTVRLCMRLRDELPHLIERAETHAVMTAPPVPGLSVVDSAGLPNYLTAFFLQCPELADLVLP